MKHAVVKPYQNTTRESVSVVSPLPAAIPSFVLDEGESIPKPSDLKQTKTTSLIKILSPLQTTAIDADLGDIWLEPKETSGVAGSASSISPILSVRFDNDIFDNTDYYYTNGIKLALYTKAAGWSPLDKLLVKQQNGIVLRGFSVTQKMYTPTNPETEEILYGDYSFSGFLTFGQFSESYNLRKQLIVKSSIELGVLGPASMSGRVQALVHKKEPTGWKYQISNSPVVNYSVAIEKGLISNGFFEWNATGQVEAGTLFDNLQLGTYLRVGSFVPVIRGPEFISKAGYKKHLQYWFFIRSDIKFVGYNATLQGGMFNDKSAYTISSSTINRTLFEASVGVAVYYGNFGLELENCYNSPEFKEAYDFRYGGISLLYGF